MTKLFGLVGAGGFAREVLPLASAAHPDATLYIVETTPTMTTLRGIPVLSESEFLNMAGEKFFCIAIADAKARQAIAERFATHATPITLVAPTAYNDGSVVIGEGSILCPGSIVTADACIGRHFHANFHSYVAHDCIIGDYVTFAPGVLCNGNVHIGDHAYIGAGAVIKQGTKQQPLTIGEGAIVGMGAVVTQSVPPGATVVGNPARPLEKN